MTPSRERQLIDGVWQYKTVEEPGGGAQTGIPLEDPGHVWSAGLAVTDGYQIAVTWLGESRVFEAVGAGTTADDGSVFPDDYNPLLTPLGETAENVTWRYLGIVGQVSWASAPQLLGVVVGAEGFQYAARFTIGDAETFFALLPALEDGTPDTQHPVFVTNTAGDADWFLDTNNGSGFRFNRSEDGVPVGGGETQMTADGFRVNFDDTHSFEVQFSPFLIRVLGLPTSDPGAGHVGELWNDGGTLKVSAGV